MASSPSLLRSLLIGAACFPLAFATLSFGQDGSFPRSSPMQTGVLGIDAFEFVDHPINYRYVGNPRATPNAWYQLSVHNGANCPPGHIYTLRIVILASTNDPRGPAASVTYTQTFDTSSKWYFQPDGWTPRAYGQHLKAYFYLVNDQLSSAAADNRANVAAAANRPRLTGPPAVPGAAYNVDRAPIHVNTSTGASPVIINAATDSAPPSQRGSRGTGAPSSERIIINADAPAIADPGPSSRPGVTVINAGSDDDQPTPTPRPTRRKAPASTKHEPTHK